MAKKQATKKVAARSGTTHRTKKAAKKAVPKPYTEESLLAIVRQSRDELMQQQVIHNLAVESLQKHFPDQGADMRELTHVVRASGTHLGMIDDDSETGGSQCDFLRRSRDRATDPVVKRLIEEKIATECH